MLSARVEQHVLDAMADVGGVDSTPNETGDHTIAVRVLCMVRCFAVYSSGRSSFWAIYY